MNYCYVLIEWLSAGCATQMRIVTVTTNQQFAYNWQQATVDIQIKREVQRVTLI